MWNFLVKSREFLLPHLSWVINSGDKALFWSNSWNGFPPNSSLNQLNTTQAILEILWGTKVKDYISFKSTNGLSNVVWKIFPGLPIPQIEKT